MVEIQKPVSFISFDVEALPGRASEEHVDRLVWGKIQGEEFGIRRICDVLNQHKIKGNFLVDFAMGPQYGDRAVMKIIQFILEQGHEVHTHLHPLQLTRLWGFNAKERFEMDQLDEEMNKKFMDFVVFKYRQVTGKDPDLFRAGAFMFNDFTIKAAKEAGFRAMSNFNHSRHLKCWELSEEALNNEPFMWGNGLIELPVDFSPEPLSFNWDLYDGVFDRVKYRKKIKTLNLVMHSWSLLSKSPNGLFESFDSNHENKLHQICEHLTTHTTAKGYSDYLKENFLFPKLTSAQCLSSSIDISDTLNSCSLCGAMYGKELDNDICLGCGSRTRHRQIKDVISQKGNPFDNLKVLACYANTLEKQSFLSNTSYLLNFDVRPVGEVDIQMDMQNMDKIEDSSFDCFFAIHVLNHVKDDRLALREIYRVLKPGGFAFLTIPYRTESKTELLENLTEHYGTDALSKYGVGSYRRYGFDDAQSAFSELFDVETIDGYDQMKKETQKIFILKKN